MRLGTLAFFLGILFCQTFSSLPDTRWILLIFPFWIFPRYRLLFLFALGLLWTVWRADMILAQKIPNNLEGQNIAMIGTIISLPVQRRYDQSWRFEFAPIPFKDWPNPGHLRLYWDGDPPQSLRPGQRWQLTVRLKRARGLLNPGVYDYSKWLFQNRIQATGYVRGEHRLLSEPSLFSIDNLRYHLAEKIRKALGDSPSTEILLALALGEKQGISQQQRDTLLLTGTAHLVAISGLHIGSITFLTILLIWLAYRWLYPSQVALWLPVPHFAALLSLLTAFLYALLAGFSLPTQRALIMVAVAVSSLMFARTVAVSHKLTLALLLVLLYDPLSVMSISFWLSFGTVTILVYALSGKQSLNFSWWSHFLLLRMQWVLLLGLLPVSLFLFNFISLTSFFANLIAVPWISFVILPLTLLGTAIIVPLPALGAGLLQTAAFTFDALWVSIDWLAHLSVWRQAIPPLWAILVAMIGSAILLLPRGFPARWLGIIWLLPIFFTPPVHPNRDEVWFTLLDVGQGLAAVIRTKNYVLVYDTGPKFRSGFNTGDAVVVPFLRTKGIHQVDKLLISHGDNDHSGGAESVLKNLAVTEVLTSAPEQFKDSKRCQAGQRWRWDDVDFQILHPPHATGKGNNHSCVLKVSSTGGAILLPGDIEKTVEYRLVQKTELKADILIVPHHGSGTSSSEIFIDAVQPTIALFSVGYRNYFRHPKKSVVERYRRRGVSVWDTAQAGAIQFRLSARGISSPILAREAMRRYWHD